MNVTLPATQLPPIDRCVRAFLSPSAWPDRAACRTACIEATTRLVRLDGRSPRQRTPVSESPDGEADPASFWKLDVAYQIRRRRFGLEVLHLSLLFPRRTQELVSLRRTKVRSVAPSHALPESGPVRPASVAAVPCHACREHAMPSLGDGLNLLRALLPAFQAGVRATMRVDPQRSELARLFGLVADTVLTFGPARDGVAPRGGRGKLPSVSPDPMRLCQEIQQLAEGLSAHQKPESAPGVQEISLWVGNVRSGGAGQCLSGRHVGIAGKLGSAPIMLLSLKRRRPPRLVPESPARLKLTAREYDVAVLVAERRSNREIAAALGISSHTARHHTEQVLAKLGVHTRAGVRARLVPES